MRRSHRIPPPYLADERSRTRPLGLSDDLAAQDATRPDIVPAPLRFAEEEEFTVDRYWDAESPAYIDLPEVRLAYRERRPEPACAVLLHRAKRELAGTSRESLLERRLQHALIIPVVDQIEFGGEPMLVMEYAAAVTLSTLERQWSPLKPAIGVAIACDVLRALHAGHGATSPDGRLLGFAHGCLSPREILVGTDGRARLVDFALAEDMGRTLGERVNRNRGYFAPEQVFERRLDARTDVFSAGVVLWECLTGYALLGGDDPVERLLKLMTVGCDRPSRFNPEVTPELDAVIARALEPAPERRFQSAGEFVLALSATLRPASASDVAERVGSVAKTFLEKQETWRRQASEAPASRVRTVLVSRSPRSRPKDSHAALRGSAAALETLGDSLVSDAAPARSHWGMVSDPNAITLPPPNSVPTLPPLRTRPTVPSKATERSRDARARTKPTVSSVARERHAGKTEMTARPRGFAWRRTLPFVALAACGALLAGFFLSQRRSDAGVPLRYSTVIGGPSSIASAARAHLAERTRASQNARPAASASDRPEVPVLLLEELPPKEAERSEPETKRRPSLASRRKPAR